MKFTYQLAANDHLSVRFSHQNARSYDPADLRHLRRPEAIRRNRHQPDLQFGHHLQPRVVGHTGSGSAYRPDVASQRGDSGHHGLKTSDELGIRGVNLNDFTSGITTIDSAATRLGGPDGYLLGFETSLPWDRAERTWTISHDRDQTVGEPHLKIGGDLRMNRHLLDQVTTRAVPSVSAAPNTALNTDTAAQNGYANALAAFLLDVPQSIERGLVSETIHAAGDHKSVYSYVHDKWQVRSNITLDLGLRHEVYTPLVGYTPKGGLANYDPSNNTSK